MQRKNPLNKLTEEFNILLYNKEILSDSYFRKHKNKIIKTLKRASKFLNGDTIVRIKSTKSCYRLRVTMKGEGIRLTFLGFTNPNYIVLIDIGTKKKEKEMISFLERNFKEIETFEEYKKLYPNKVNNIVNPINNEKIEKAILLYKEFNNYEPEKLLKMQIPLDKNTVFVKLGEVENLEYISDKAIFKTDKKTKKRKIRTYIHNFLEHDKRPLLLTNEQGNILVLYDPENKIEVKKEGII